MRRDSSTKSCRDCYEAHEPPRAASKLKPASHVASATRCTEHLIDKAYARRLRPDRQPDRGVEAGVGAEGVEGKQPLEVYGLLL